MMIVFMVKIFVFHAENPDGLEKSNNRRNECPAEKKIENSPNIVTKIKVMDTGPSEEEGQYARSEFCLHRNEVKNYQVFFCVRRRHIKYTPTIKKTKAVGIHIGERTQSQGQSICLVSFNAIKRRVNPLKKNEPAWLELFCCDILYLVKDSFFCFTFTFSPNFQTIATVRAITEGANANIIGAVQPSGLFNFFNRFNVSPFLFFH